MPTSLPARRSEIVRADDFPLHTMLTVAVLGIAAGLWLDSRNEAAGAMAIPAATVADARAPSIELAALQLTDPLSGLRFAP